MLRFGVVGIVGLLLIGLWIWALIDCITTDSKLCRNLPKGIWLVIVIFLPDIGSLLWLLAGRPVNKRWRPATGADGSRPRRAIGIDDRQGLDGAITDRRSAELDRRLAAWEADQRERDARKRDLEDP